MALKDWKKVSINQWRKKNKLLRISQNLSSKLWGVVVKSELSGFFFIDAEFKTKSKALRFAMNYMRKY